MSTFLSKISKIGVVAVAFSCLAFASVAAEAQMRHQQNYGQEQEGNRGGQDRAYDNHARTGSHGWRQGRGYGNNAHAGRHGGRQGHGYNTYGRGEGHQNHGWEHHNGHQR